MESNPYYGASMLTCGVFERREADAIAGWQVRPGEDSATP